MKLVYKKSGNVVLPQDVVETSKGMKVEVLSFQPPHKPGSSGKVCVRSLENGWTQQFFVGVIGAEWIEREDRSPLNFNLG